MSHTIHHKDCIAGLKELVNNSADIIICDPPYNIGKDFGNDTDKQQFDEYLLWCDAWIAQCIRVLKPTGTLYIYGFSEILAFIRTRINIQVRWLVWHYTNKVSPNLHFWQRTHESILCCTKGDGAVFNRDAIREPYTDAYKKTGGKKRAGTHGRFGSKETVYNVHPDGALPRDVLKIPALAGGAGKKERVDHPTQKPMELCEKLIRASMNTDNHTLLVVPFVGSGSECVAGKNLGIDVIGYEVNEVYVQLARSRLA